MVRLPVTTPHHQPQYDGMSDTLIRINGHLNAGFTALFTIECTLKMIGYGVRVRNRPRPSFSFLYHLNHAQFQTHHWIARGLGLLGVPSLLIYYACCFAECVWFVFFSFQNMLLDMRIFHSFSLQIILFFISFFKT